MKDGRVIFQGEPRDAFSSTELVEESRVRVPQISKLFYELRRAGIDFGSLPITVEEAYQILRRVLRRKEGFEFRKEGRGSSRPLIKVEGLWFRYENGVEALRDVNIEIFPGEFVAIIGQNGAGKTTLAKHFNGLLKPTKGDVIVDGINTKEARMTDLAKIVGYVFQNPDHQFFSLTVEEEVAFGPRNLGLSEEEVKQRVEEALKLVGLERVRDRYPFNLSRGQRQKLAVASVLAMRPKIIVLDEPTTGQDEVAISQILGLVNRLRREGKTILMITHDMSIVASYAERTVVMSQGRILMDGPTREVFSHPELLEKSYIDLPPITKLASMLSEFGIPKNVLTVEEMRDLIVERVE
jgi:energy-coupling factor transport system ATP-binding protein